MKLYHACRKSMGYQQFKSVCNSREFDGIGAPMPLLNSIQLPYIN
jgi:hypothetical protein